MAEEPRHHESHECENPVIVEENVEAKDRGLFDFMGKKEEEKPQEEVHVVSAEFEEKVNIAEEEEKKPCKEEEKHESLIAKLHRSDSSSSSSSDEEGADEEKKKKKKEKKEKKEKHGDHKHEEETVIPVEKCEDKPEEKKGFLEKIKEKLPGQKKTTEEGVVDSHTPPAPVHVAVPESHPTPPPPCAEEEPKEKKGLLEKIKEKLPGYHPKSGDEEKKDKDAGESH